MRHPELDSGSHSFFFKHCLIFFIPYLFLFFHKNYYYFSKGKETAQSPKPDSFEFDLFTVDISSQMTPARLCRSRLDAAVQSSVALLGVIRCSYTPPSLGAVLRIWPLQKWIYLHKWSSFVAT